MNIGAPRKVIEVEPESLPVPDVLPMPEPAREPAVPEPDPTEEPVSAE